MEPEQLRTIYRRQARWFADERNRLLRQAAIARKHAILDLGAGTGECLSELRRRAGGRVIGLDSQVPVLRLADGQRVAGSARALPFPDNTFDLIFTQMFFLWAQPIDAIIPEVRRVLMPGGHLIAVAEPDYGGAIQYPQTENGIQTLAARLTRQGADIHIGRKLSALLQAHGFRVECRTHTSLPLHAAQHPTHFASPELWQPPKELTFLHLPHFAFLAAR